MKRNELFRNGMTLLFYKKQRKQLDDHRMGVQGFRGYCISKPFRPNNALESYFFKKYQAAKTSDYLLQFKPG